jgi:hypothetical protein
MNNGSWEVHQGIWRTAGEKQSGATHGQARRTIRRDAQPGETHIWARPTAGETQQRARPTPGETKRQARRNGGQNAKAGGTQRQAGRNGRQDATWARRKGRQDVKAGETKRPARCEGFVLLKLFFLGFFLFKLSYLETC